MLELNVSIFEEVLKFLYYDNHYLAKDEKEGVHILMMKEGRKRMVVQSNVYEMNRAGMDLFHCLLFRLYKMMVGEDIESKMENHDKIYGDHKSLFYYWNYFRYDRLQEEEMETFCYKDMMTLLMSDNIHKMVFEETLKKSEMEEMDLLSYNSPASNLSSCCCILIQILHHLLGSEKMDN